MFSQNTKGSLKISIPAFDLMVKDLQKFEKLKVAYKIQSADLIKLADTNLEQLKEIQLLQTKNEFWQQQVDQKEAEIVKLQKKKSNGTTWLSIGAVGGLILGVIIAK